MERWKSHFIELCRSDIPLLEIMSNLPNLVNEMIMSGEDVTDIHNIVLKWSSRTGNLNLFKESMNFNDIMHYSIRCGQLCIIKFLIEEYGMTDNGKFLVSSVKEGQNEVFMYLLDHNFADTNGGYETSLREACNKGNNVIVRLLLDKGLDVHMKSDILLVEAVTGGHLDVIKLLLDRRDLDHVYTEFPLTRAIDNGKDEAAELLITTLLDCLNTSNAVGLEYAVRDGRSDIVRLLLTHCNHDIKHINAQMHIACKNGNLEIVRLLLNSGGDVHYSNGSCLSVSSEYGHYEIAKLLIERGAISGGSYSKVNSINNASDGGHYNIVKLLIDNRDESNWYGLQTPIPIKDNRALYLACSGGHLNITTLLIKTGTKVEDNPDYLIAACIKGHLDIIKLLIANGSDIDVSYGFLMLMAYNARQYDVLRLLVYSGISRVKTGYILAYAASRGNLEIVKLLAEQGWDIHMGNDEALRTSDDVNVIKYLVSKGVYHEDKYKIVKDNFYEWILDITIPPEFPRTKAMEESEALVNNHKKWKDRNARPKAYADLAFVF